MCEGGGRTRMRWSRRQYGEGDTETLRNRDLETNTKHTKNTGT